MIDISEVCATCDLFNNGCTSVKPYESCAGYMPKKGTELCPTCKLFNNGCTPTEPAYSCVGYAFKEDTHSDRVNHPNHYTQGGIECIRAIEASMSPDGFQDYCKGNVLKYIWRWRDKNGLEDLEKAAVYLNWMIESAKKYAGGIEECL